MKVFRVWQIFEVFLLVFRFCEKVKKEVNDMIKDSFGQQLKGGGGSNPALVLKTMDGPNKFGT